jgi:ferredoxin--NADP+ reductase
MDVARILAKTPAELVETDIVDYALAKLATSQIRDIYVLARRGPAQVKFTPPEIKEIGGLASADVVVRANELELDPQSAAEVANDPEAQRNLEYLHAYALRPLTGKPRRIYFRFLVSPVELIGQEGKVQAVRIERNELRADASGTLSAQGSGEFEVVRAGLVLRSVGYKGIPLEDVPYDTRSGIIPNDKGRVKEPGTGAIRPGEYVVGWAKRGPSGVIGTNKPDAMETVERMLADIPQTTPARQPDPAAIEGLLEERQLEFIDMNEWRVLDQIEVANGVTLGKPRVKFTRLQDMLEALHAHIKLKREHG